MFILSILARISGVNIPSTKRVAIALTYIHGIGYNSALSICGSVNVNPDKKVSQLTENEMASLRDSLAHGYLVEGDLRRKVSVDIKELVDMKCYRGMRHIRRLPVRGQRTHTNARTRKGKAVAIAGKKKVAK